MRIALCAAAFISLTAIAQAPQTSVPVQAQQHAPCRAKLPPPVVPGPQMSQYSADRENAMAPVNLAYRCQDYEGAYQLNHKLLDTYPKDVGVLTMAGDSAGRTGRLEEAVALYRRAFSLNDRYSWNLRARLMQAFIQLGRWPDFEAERLDTRKASLAGHDTTLPAAEGYIRRDTRHHLDVSGSCQIKPHIMLKQHGLQDKTPTPERLQ